MPNNVVQLKGHIFEEIIRKGQLQGHTVIFKGLKMTFRTKILKKKNFTTLISSKNTTNFVSALEAALGGERGEQL